MLYKKNNTKELSADLFRNPTSEYRGTPFWAWNSKLDEALLLKEIEQLKEMGMGGVHIHCRTGMATEYLSDEFMNLVKSCNAKLKKEEMLCWLYDEDRWPSGAAGGLVTKDHQYRARFLVFSPKSYEKNSDSTQEAFSSSARNQRSIDRTLLGIYEVVIKEGCLDYYKKIDQESQVSHGGKVWWAYLEVAGDSPWFNDQAYVNTLDKKAIERFVEITHERYYQELGKEFGASIPAIFTDEPQFTHKESFGFATEEKEVFLPFTDDFDETFQSAYKVSLLDHLPELFWDLPNRELSQIRYRYHDHLSERFTEAFSDTVGAWCDSHQIMLTGHMMEEPTLRSQTTALGEAMRSYRSFQLPGIDMLCDWREYSTAKQAQSASAQYGRDGVLSEIYGVTNWDFDFRGHKLAGDWQAALGVTTRVHHLTWVSMGGEAKRDYPACIGYQSPWYKEYPLIEDHFSRLNTALTRGKPVVRVGVIHPIESYWLHFGPMEQTAIIREELETRFSNITEWLLFGLIDFHFISESLLPVQSTIEESHVFHVGEMNYDVIIVPGNETLRSTTVERLQAFAKAGGKLVFLGEPATLIDAAVSDKTIQLAKECITLPFSKSRILNALEENREIEIRTKAGTPSENLFYQLREDGQKRWLFICHVNKMLNPDVPSIEEISITVKGNWVPTIYNTMNGYIEACCAETEGFNTVIQHAFSQHDSLLLCLEEKGAGICLSTEGEKTAEDDSSRKLCIKDVETEQSRDVTAEDAKKNASENVISKSIQFLDPVAVTLSEPNVLLLDMAEYQFDDGPWMAKEEILRIDNAFRKELQFPLRLEAFAQPWVHPEEEDYHHILRLKFTIASEIVIDKPCLALENTENTQITVNGVKISNFAEGWFVDESIKKVQLPSLPKGNSEIILEIAYNSKTNVEWCYLLGDFGVQVAGSHAKIIEPVSSLSFGDWCNQGLPFYAGNVTYHCIANFDEGDVCIEATQFRNPVLTVALDNEKKGSIAFAPYRLNLGSMKKGEHTIDITAFGNRANAFGTIHNCNHTTSWFGPDGWRTTGSSWSYEYVLKQMGILVKPIITQ